MAETVEPIPYSTEETGEGLPEGEKNAQDDIDFKIFVGGISWTTTDDGLKYYFGKFGKVESVNLMKDRITGQPRGFAFVQFQDKTVIDVVLEVETHTIDGRNVDVKRAVPRDQAPSRGTNSNRPVEALKIFVGGLAPSVTEEEFKKYFSNFGTVTDAVVMIDRKTSRSRGFGFITFENEAAVKETLKQTHLIHDKAVEIKQAQPRDATAYRYNNKGGFGPYGGYGYPGGYGYGYPGYGGGRGYGGYGGGGRGGYGGYGGGRGYAGYHSGGYGGYGYGGYGGYQGAAYGGYGGYGGDYGYGAQSGYGASGYGAQSGYGYGSTQSPGYGGSSSYGGQVSSSQQGSYSGGFNGSSPQMDYGGSPSAGASGYSGKW